jgi:hypothetical protein
MHKLFWKSYETSLVISKLVSSQCIVGIYIGAQRYSILNNAHIFMHYVVYHVGHRDCISHVRVPSRLLRVFGLVHYYAQ